ALPPSDPELGLMIYFSLGNHFLAIDDLELAYDAYRNALLLNPADADAKHNLEVVLARIFERDQPPEEQPGGQQGQPGEGQNGEQPQQGQSGEEGEGEGEPGEGEQQP